MSVGSSRNAPRGTALPSVRVTCQNFHPWQRNLVRPPFEQRLEKGLPLVDVEAEHRVIAPIVGHYGTVEPPPGLAARTLGQQPQQMQEDQVQGGEALLAVDEEAAPALFLRVDERAEEELLAVADRPLDVRARPF